MRISLRACAATAFALLLVAVVAALLSAGLSSRNAHAPASRGLAVAEAPEVKGVMPCLYHVMIIHEVHWAAACMKNDPPDNGPDCMLPPERAAALNGAEQEAEAFCERRGT